MMERDGELKALPGDPCAVSLGPILLAVRTVLVRGSVPSVWSGGARGAVYSFIIHSHSRLGERRTAVTRVL